MNKDEKRITKIKNDHAELLKMVRDDIIENDGKLDESIEKVIKVLDFDEKSIKSYQATIAAQELVASLTKKILEAKTKEEVCEIRKKLNYYINKIKSEMKKRNLNESYLNDYQDKVSYLRKDIAKYIRFLKREDNIVEIERLYSRYKELNHEEMVNLKKALKREIAYNKRNLNEFNSNEKLEIIKNTKVKVLKESKKEVNKEEKVTSIDGNPFQLIIPEDKTPKDPFLYEEKPTPKDKPRFYLKNIRNADFIEVEGYLNGKIKDYNRLYRIEDTHDYSRNNLGKNVIHFFRNLPHYIHNKKAVKKMKSDYYRFYNGNDLGSYIEYLKHRNSISEGLKCMFSKSHLYNNNDIIKHEMCSRWLFDFCRRHGMDIHFQKNKKYNTI